jgi:phosphatidylglycerophosphate synthase
MTLARYVTVPNALSASRIVFLPLLWALALLRLGVPFTIAYALVGITDLFDGFAARRLNQRSAFGKTLDSFADLLYYLSSAFFLAWLYMDYLRPNLVLLYILFGVLALSFVVSAIRCGKPIMMHTLMLKLNAVLVYVGIILSAFFDTTVLVTVVLAVYYVSYAEEILIFLVHGEVDPDSPTIFNVRPKPKRERA